MGYLWARRQLLWVQGKGGGRRAANRTWATGRLRQRKRTPIWRSLGMLRFNRGVATLLKVVLDDRVVLLYVRPVVRGPMVLRTAAV